METQVSSGAATMETSAAKPCCRRAVTVVRLLMGLAFFTFGLNGFLHFMPEPKTLPEPVMSLMGAFMKSGYMFPLVFGTQLVVGVLLLANRFVPLALVLIAPVLVHILAFHIYLQPAGIGPGAVLTIMEIYLAWAYRDAFRPLLTARATAGSSCAR